MAKNLEVSEVKDCPVEVLIKPVIGCEGTVGGVDISPSPIYDDAAAEDLGGALLAVKTLLTDESQQTGEGVDLIVIRTKPGWRFVNGEPVYSADWL